MRHRESHDLGQDHISVSPHDQSALEGEQHQERHHQTEQTHRLRQCEACNRDRACAKATKVRLPRMAYWKSWPLSDGLRAYAMISEPNTVPIPAPEPAAPVVAAPAPA